MKFRLSLAALAGLALAGCNVLPQPQQDLTRYFVLTAPTRAAAGAGAPGALRLGLKQVELADYLQTRDIVVRSGPNELALQDYARWAEPLQAGIARALGARLLEDPGVASVATPPFPLGAARDYDVSVQILHCEGESGAALFAARVEIASAADGRVVSRLVYVAPREKWNGSDYGRLAALLSDDVAGLGADILSALPSR